MKFIANHENRACDIVKEMLDQLTAKMRELGLKSLRLEDEPTIVVYIYEQSGGYDRIEEFIVQGICLSDEDGLVLRTTPCSPYTKFVNECETGPDCPEIDYDEDYDFIAVDSDDIQYFSLLNLSTPISDAFDNYEDKSNNK